MSNAYDLPNCDINTRVVITNKSVLTPARSFGVFPTRFALERAIDMIAGRIGMEPAEVRRINLIRDLPYVTATGLNYDSGNWIGAYDLLLERIDLKDFRRRQATALREGRYIGIGYGVGAETSGVASDVLVPMENQPATAQRQCESILAARSASLRAMRRKGKTTKPPWLKSRRTSSALRLKILR